MITNNGKVFYRYRHFSARTVDLLCHDKLYFAKPSMLNDPLDCRPTLRPDSSLDDLRALLSYLVKTRVRTEILDLLDRARFWGKRAETHAQKQADLESTRVLNEIVHYAEDPDYEVPAEQAESYLLTHTIQGELARHYERGVCCFSSTYSDPLLWSHYGNQHRGLCIGYDLIREPRPLLHKVLYGKSRIIKTSTIVAALLHDKEEAQGSLDHDMLLIKARGWSYEREWRLIGRQGEQDSSLRLREVVFGLRCPDSVKHTVVGALRDRDQPVRFFEIYEIHGSYRLARREPDLGELSRYFPRTARSGKEIFNGVTND